MPLRSAGEPVGGERVLAEALRRHSPRAAMGGRADPVTPFLKRSEATVGVPHPVYDLLLDDLTSGGTLSTARCRAWRYLLFEGPAAVGLAEVASDVSGNALNVSALNSGPFVSATEDGIRQAESLPEVSKGSFELRVLRVSALYVLALWLKDQRGSNDLLIPLAPAPPYLTAGHAYQPDEFLDHLRRAAASRSNFDSSPRS